MEQGKIKAIVEGKGFGFIGRPGQKDMFFHATGVRGISIEELQVGDVVEFEIAEGEKGPHAVQVRLVTAN